ncbi:MAG: Holliday junction resolvase Hjc [Candidatus Heimdallarchaeaceae archaeon]
MSIKKKATDYERALVNRFWEHGFAVMRAPSSSGTPMIPLPDIFAGSVEKGLFFAIELKTSKQEFFYVKKSQIEGLEEFAKRIGAYPILGVKFIGKRMDFLFLPVPDALTPSGGESYKVDINETIHKGIDFEILIKPETWEKKD